MRPRFKIAALLAWLAAAAAAFAFFQFRDSIKFSPFAGYALAAVFSLLVIAVAAGLGLRLVAGAIRPGRIVAASAVGLALLGVATLLLCSAGLLRPYVIWPLLAVAGVLCRRQIGEAAACLSRIEFPAPGVADLLLVVAGASGALVLLVNCLAPLTANDALVYHLNVPKIYAETGGLARLPYNVYANMPHYGEMLYAVAFSAAGETGARVLYCFAVLGAAAAIYALARMFTGRRPSLVVALAFLVQPLVLDHRVVCNVDILLTFFLVSAVIMLLEDRRRVPATTRLSIAVGLVAGFMLGIKYTAIAPCLALLVLPLVAVPRSVAPRSLAAAVLVAALIFAPWLVKNEIHIGNPVYPMLESTFDGANWDSAQARQLIAWQRGMGMGKGAADYLLLPFNVSLRGRPESAYRFFDGTVSPLLLMLIPLAAIRPTRHTWALAIMAGAVFIFWAVTSQQLRFLMPALALGCVVAAIGLGRLADGAGSGGIKIVTAVAAVVMGFSIVVPDQYGRSTVSGAFGDRLAVALGLEGRRQYLERSVQSYAMFEHINRTVPRREPILMVWENRGYYLDSPYIADSFFEASTVMRMADAAGDAAGFEEAIRAAGIKYVLVNEWLGEYFSRSYPAADTAMLRAFIETSLEPVHTSNRLTLYKIKPA